MHSWILFTMGRRPKYLKIDWNKPCAWAEAVYTPDKKHYTVATNLNDYDNLDEPIETRELIPIDKLTRLDTLLIEDYSLGKEDPYCLREIDGVLYK